MKSHFERALIVFAFFSFLFACRSPNHREGMSEGATVAAPVKVMTAKRETITEQIHKTGLIQAWRETNVTPTIGGKIEKIHVYEGEMVKAGQLLAELDMRTAQLQLEQARAGVAVAEANYKDVKRNLERMERLNQENAVSEQQYEKVQLLFEAAEAQLQQANSVLNLANHNVEVSRLTAPFGGIVASLNAEEGDVINPMMVGFFPNSGILTLMDYSRIRIKVEVLEREVVRIEKGQSARISVASFPERKFQGVVSTVNLAADPMSKKFTVEVIIDNPGQELKPNTFGKVSFIVNIQENALVIPLRAVLDNSHVFVVQGETVKRKDVVLGLQNADLVEIREGLEEGDLVVIEGNFGLQEEMVIEISEILK